MMLYFIIVFTLVLSSLIIYRLNKEAGVGCITGAWIVIVVGTISLLFFMFSFVFLHPIYYTITLPHYEATVKKVELNKNAKGTAKQKRRSKYLITLSFKDKNGDLAYQCNNQIIRSYHPEIGQKMRVACHLEQLYEVPAGRITRNIFILTLPLITLSYFVYYAFAYGLGQSTDHIQKFGLKVLAFGIMPLAMLWLWFLLTMLLKVFFLNGHPNALIVIPVCSFFWLILTYTIPALVWGIWRGEITLDDIQY